MNNLLQRDYLNYLANEFLDDIKVKSILDDVEKKYLSEIIRPFKNRVINIIKCSMMAEDEVYIDIRVKSISDDCSDGYTESILLPIFKIDTMYKNMQCDKRYTLKELDLD